MTINEFAKNLDAATDNPLIEAVNELRLDENMGAILDTTDEIGPWSEW